MRRKLARADRRPEFTRCEQGSFGRRKLNLVARSPRNGGPQAGARHWQMPLPPIHLRYARVFGEGIISDATAASLCDNAPTPACSAGQLWLTSGAFAREERLLHTRGQAMAMILYFGPLPSAADTPFSEPRFRARYDSASGGPSPSLRLGSTHSTAPPDDVGREPRSCLSRIG
jgi:hypothetical protein